jgi:hypothetical protein
MYGGQCGEQRAGINFAPCIAESDEQTPVFALNPKAPDWPKDRGILVQTEFCAIVKVLIWFSFMILQIL